MRQNRKALTGVLAFCGVMILAGCVDNQIGRPCNNLGKDPQSGVTFVNPAPDCPTRLCMVTPAIAKVKSGTTCTAADCSTRHETVSLSMCTAECSSDDDCATADDYKVAERCPSRKFACAVPSVLPGSDNFCCKKMCMCADDLIAGFNKDDPNSVGKIGRDPDTGLPIPVACLPSNPKRCQF